MSQPTAQTFPRPRDAGTGVQRGIVLGAALRPAAALRWATCSALLLGLVACGAATSPNGGTSTGMGTPSTDPIVFQNSAMPAAYVGEPFSASVAVLGGVGPYSYRVVAGSLPPGITVSGTNLAGTPTTTGPYSFTVEVTDANLSTKVNVYTLNVNELLPLTIEPELPSGQIRGETRVPLKINAARGVRAASVTWDLGNNIKVTKVQATDPSNVMMWQQQGSLLTLALGFKTVPRSGTRIALISVKPGQTVTLESTRFWFDSRDGSGKVLGDRKMPAVTPVSPLGAPTLDSPAAGQPAAVSPAANGGPVNSGPVNSSPASGSSAGGNRVSSGPGSGSAGANGSGSPDSSGSGSSGPVSSGPVSNGSGTSPVLPAPAGPQPSSTSPVTPLVAPTTPASGK